MNREAELLRDIRYALGFKSLTRGLAELDATIEAGPILEHLKRCGWEFSHRPPAPLHRVASCNIGRGFAWLSFPISGGASIAREPDILRKSRIRRDWPTTVRGGLARAGGPDGVILESWHGKENPAVPTPDGVREPRNRRVEIVE